MVCALIFKTTVIVALAPVFIGPTLQVTFDPVNMQEPALGVLDTKWRIWRSLYLHQKFTAGQSTAVDMLRALVPAVRFLCQRSASRTLPATQLPVLG